MSKLDEASKSDPPPSSEDPASSEKPKVVLAKEIPHSSGAMAAFRAQLDDAPPVPKPEPSAPHSLAGASLDVGPPSDAQALEPAPPASRRFWIVALVVAIGIALLAYLLTRS